MSNASNVVLAAVAALLGAGALGAAVPVVPLADSFSTAVADTARVKLAIQGMTCGSCATTARLALKRVEGVLDATVWYDSASAVVLYDPARTSPEQFIARLERMTGYKAAVVDERAKPEGV